MRIADVAEFYAPNGGGVRSYIDRKFEAAADAGHELFVLVPAAEDRWEPRRAGGVVHIKSPPLPVDPNYRMFWRAAPVHRCLDQLKPDVVEASSPWRGAHIVAQWASSTPRAMFFHADPVASYPHRWLSPFLARDRIDELFGWFWSYLRSLTLRYDSLVVGSDWLARRLESQRIGPVQSIPLGIDRGVFSPTLRDPALRAGLLAECGLSENATLLLGVGRFHAEKRWPMVISATAAAAQEFPLGFVLVGDGVDRTRIGRAAAEHPHIHLLPPIRDRRALATLLASGDGLVHGCESETFGLVPAEALASGLPLIVPDLGGCSELADARFAETYRAGDPDAAADAIRRLLSRDRVDLKTAAVAASADVRRDTQHFEGLFAHFETLVGGHARAAAARALDLQGYPGSLRPAPARAEPAAVAREDQKQPWTAWLGGALSVGLLAAILLQLGGASSEALDLLSRLPASAWIVFTLLYLTQPVADMAIFRRLWKLPAAAFTTLLRKTVMNEIVLGYSGEAYFYLWARRHGRLSAAPFQAIKDVNILSALAGNGLTLVMLLVSASRLQSLNLPHHFGAALWSGAAAIAVSLVVLMLAPRVFSLPRRQLAFVGCVHALRLTAISALTILVWSLALPGMAIETWISLLAIRLLVARIPLLANKDLVFGNLVLLIAGPHSPVGVLLAGLALATLMAHLAVIGLTGARDALRPAESTS